MENSSVLSLDSLGESELDLLRDKLKQKEHIINEKSQIIDSLRQQVKDLVQDNEEMENNQQLLHQKIDRMTKDLEEKNEDLESLSHTLKEVESAHEKLEKRMEARTGQVQKFAEDLLQAKKELEETRLLNEELQHKNEKLATELDLANSRRRAHQELRQEEELQQKQQQQHNQQNQYSHHHNHHSHQDEYKPRTQKFSTALNFPIADEIGEFMDSSSQLSSTTSEETQLPKACQYHIHKQTQRLPPATVTKHHHHEQHVRVKHERFVDVALEPESATTAMETQPTVVLSALKQEKVLTRQESNFMRQQQLVATHKRELSYEEEHAMRVARAQELARRNAKTKPLHQTSYALELDTFDTTNFNEQEIKKGNIRPPQRAPPQPPISQPSRQTGPTRRALANCSNTPPVVKRQVYKKAEAFIV